MKITALRSLPRLDALLQLMLLLLALTPLLPIHEAAALAPQDSTHFVRDFEKLPGERFAAPKVINNRIYYKSAERPPFSIRSRDFNGALISDHPTSAFNPDTISSFDVSIDGRLYYTINTAKQYPKRIAIVAPDGTYLGDFGPEGKVKGNVGFSRLSLFAVSPVTGRVYVTNENSNDNESYIPSKKGLVQVFDRDGNFLHEFRTTGLLASTLEGPIKSLHVRGAAEGQDELYIYDAQNEFGRWFHQNLKVFGGDGKFHRFVTGWVFGVPQGCFFWKDFLIITGFGSVRVFPAALSDGSEVIADMTINNTVNNTEKLIGFNDLGGMITVFGNDGESLRQSSYPNFSNFDAVTRNAVPNPWVLGVSQRPGGGIVDIDYQVDDANDTAVTTALVAFASGVASLSNVLPMNTLIEGTGTRVGANQPTGAVQRLTWNAGSDWNVDFGTLRVMALARDSRSHWFDVHLVEIPADGDRPAVTISRNPLLESDFLTQFLWLVAKKDPSVNLIDGVLFGTTGADNGVILANGTSSTPAGREFLLKRDGLRVATNAEVVRAREGATPGFEVRLDPPLQMSRPTGTFPNKINEFGVESGGVATPGAWYVVRATAG
jgi:hypothetical protein